MPGYSTPILLRRYLLLGGGLVGGVVLVHKAATNGRNEYPIEIDIQTFKLLERAHGIKIGSLHSKNVLHVFFNPTCGHCARLWKESVALTKDLLFVWVPVGGALKSSAILAASLLSEPDPVAALQKNENAVLAGNSLREPEKAPEEHAIRKVAENVAIFEQFSGDGVPLVVYRVPATGKVWRRRGALPATEIKNLFV